jgi:hypothetical protein
MGSAGSALLIRITSHPFLGDCPRPPVRWPPSSAPDTSETTIPKNVTCIRLGRAGVQMSTEYGCPSASNRASRRSGVLGSSPRRLEARGRHPGDRHSSVVGPRRRSCETMPQRRCPRASPPFRSARTRCAVLQQNRSMNRRHRSTHTRESLDQRSRFSSVRGSHPAEMGSDPVERYATTRRRPLLPGSH